MDDQFGHLRALGDRGDQRAGIDDLGRHAVLHQRRHQQAHILGRAQGPTVVGSRPEAPRPRRPRTPALATVFSARTAGRPRSTIRSASSARALSDGKPGDRKDHPPVALLGRADQAIARLRGVAGLQAIGADAQLQQGVAVEAVGGGAVLVVEFGLGKDRVIVRGTPRSGAAPECPDRACSCGGRGRASRGIGEDRIGHAQAPGRVRSSGAAKASSVPASPSATTTQASLPELMIMPWISSFDRGAVAVPAETWSSRPSPCARAETAKVVSMRHTAIAQRLEQHVDGHQLGHRGRRQRLVGVLVHQHGMRGHVIDPGRRGLGLEGLGGQGGQAGQD